MISLFRILLQLMDVEFELSENIEILRRTASKLQKIEEEMRYMECSIRLLVCKLNSCSEDMQLPIFLKYIEYAEAHFDKRIAECVRKQDVAKNAYLKIQKVLHSVSQPYNSLVELSLSAVRRYRILFEDDSLPVTIVRRLMTWPREIALRRKVMLLETILMKLEIPDLLKL